jgi:hypothetical protein
MRTLLGGAKEAMRQPTGVAKACLTVIEVKGKAIRGEFSSVLVVGMLLSLLAASSKDLISRNGAILTFWNVYTKNFRNKMQD